MNFERIEMLKTFDIPFLFKHSHQECKLFNKANTPTHTSIMKFRTDEHLALNLPRLRDPTVVRINQGNEAFGPIFHIFSFNKAKYNTHTHNRQTMGVMSRFQGDAMI